MKTSAELFWAKVDKSGECWVWMACRQRNGYGKFSYQYRTMLAHRWSYEQTNGVQLTPEQLVLHSCDNRPCVNPDHLRIGTHKDNAADMDARGRRVTTSMPGEDNPRAILTASDVLEIRAWRARGGATYREIAERYGVTIQTIWAAIKGETWRDIECAS